LPRSRERCNGFAIDRRAQAIRRPTTSAAPARGTDGRGAIDYKLSWMRGPCRDVESRMTGTKLTGVARVS
jgi:hypothetical protein